MDCFDCEEGGDSRAVVSPHKQHAVSGDKDGTSEQKFRLLELPVEVLVRILLYLPTSSLNACLHVNSLLWAVIRDQYFLDRCTRRVLNLSDSRDRDVKFIDMPKNSSLLMELWFLSYDTHSSLKDGAHCFRRRDNIFFDLDCFHHSLLTWLAQSTTKDIANSDITKFGSLTKYVDNLPQFVLEPLTKLMLAFSELIEATVWATHLSLHKGEPHILQHAWHDGIQREMGDKSQCLYSLEVISGQTLESPSYLAAIVISFSFDWWIVWTGSVTQFPGCHFEKTLSIVSMSPTCTISAIKKSCMCIKELVCEYTMVNICVNEQWKRRILYPGLCYNLNQIIRNESISIIEFCASNIDNSVLSESKCSLLVARSNSCLLCCSNPAEFKMMTADFNCNNNFKLIPRKICCTDTQVNEYVNHWGKSKESMHSSQKHCKYVVDRDNKYDLIYKQLNKQHHLYDLSKHSVGHHNKYGLTCEHLEDEHNKYGLHCEHLENEQNKFDLHCEHLEDEHNKYKLHCVRQDNDYNKYDLYSTDQPNKSNQLHEDQSVSRSNELSATLDSTNNHSQFQIHECTLENLMSLHAPKQNFLFKLEAVFRREILRYTCDPDSHHVLCPSCCKLWFPSNESLSKCINQIQSKDFVPLEFWPYHIINEAVFILTRDAKEKRNCFCL